MSSKETGVEPSQAEVPSQINATLSDSSYERDPEYYMDWFTLLVEDTLFRVPKHRFIEYSEVFRDMLSLPPTASGELEGNSDNAPIRLEGVSKADFKPFLQILYPNTNKLLPTPDAYSVQQWSSFLKLATLWLFPVEIRRSAIQNLSAKRLTPCEKVVLGRLHKVGEWLIEGYHELVRSEVAISAEVAQKIGYKTASKLNRFREKDAYAKGYEQGCKGQNSANPSSRDAPKTTDTDEIEWMFVVELQEIGEQGAALGYSYRSRYWGSLLWDGKLEVIYNGNGNGVSFRTEG